MPLHVESGKAFKICQLTDIHLGNYPLNENDLKTLNGIKRILKKDKFDLIMITGDLIAGKETTEPRRSLIELYELLNEFDVPVAITYGDRDTEGNYNRKYLRDFEKNLKNLVPHNHSYVVDDHENYTLEVFDKKTDKLVNVLYVWDSGDYYKQPDISHYDTIGRHQINWYAKITKTYHVKTFDLGFMHIPLPEYKEVNKEEVSGTFNEKICSADINSGLFYELSNVGKIKALFAGHDHNNNFSANLARIQLNYGNVTGYNANSSLNRGVLAIDLYSDGVERRVLNF